MTKKSKKSRIKLQKSTRAIIIVIALVLFAFSSGNVLSAIFGKEEVKLNKEVYNYTNSFNLKYDVNIKENAFIEEAVLPMNQTYVSDLVRSLDMKMKYQYLSSEESDIKYSYKIDAVIVASHSDDGTPYEVWNKTYNLKEVKGKTATKDIYIDENINVNYAKYHEEVKAFRQEMGMALDAKLYIKLIVDTATKIGDELVKNTYASNFSISLGEKISKVDGKIEDEDKKIVTTETVIETKKSGTIIWNILLLVISAYAIYYVRVKTYIAYNIRNDFKLELNRILKSCQDRIVVVKNKVEVEGNDIIDVKSFVELIKLSEELFKPILYWSPEEEENEAQFYVMSNKIAYRYILK